MAGKKGAASKAASKKLADQVDQVEELEADTMLPPPPVDVAKSDVEDQVEEPVKEKKSRKGKKKTAEPEPEEETPEAENESGNESDGKRVVNSCVSLDLVREVKAALPDDMKVSLTQPDLKAVCETFVKTIISKVLAGDKVTLTNHFTLKRSLRNERQHVNPQKYKSDDAEFQKKIVKPAHYILSMDVKPALKKQFEEIEVVTEEPVAKEEKPARKSKKSTK